MFPLLTEYRNKLLLEGRSPITVYNVEKNLIYFSRFLGHEDMRKVTAEAVERYKVYVMTEFPNNNGGKGLSASSVEARLYTVTSYFKFLNQKKYMSFNPAINLIVPKANKKRLEYIPTESDVAELLAKPDTKNYMGLRNRALLELIYTCHLRNVEVRKLTLQDIDMNNKFIYPTNLKGEKDCGVSIADSTCKVLKRYIKLSRPILAKRSKEPTDKFFLTQYGEPFLSYGTVNVILSKYRGDKPIHARSIRHAHMLTSSTIKELTDASSAK